MSDEELERSAFGTLDPAAAPVPSFESPAIAQGDDAEPSTRASRDVCYRCRKAMSVCVCDSIPRVVNKTPVIIFQHPRERSHPVGTARFARLGLTRARVIVAHGTGKRGISRDVCVPDGTALLFPSADARPLASLAAHERPKALLVLDGTWSTAGKLFHDNPWMHQLPRVSLQPLTPGNYRIRKEPREECLSTIESIVMALGILDGTDGNDAGMREVEGLTLLLQAFTRMIDTQIVHAKQRVPRHRKPRVQKAFAARMPEAFGSEHHRALVVYTEFSYAGDDPRSKQRELVYVVAVRPSTEERFEAFLSPGVPLSGKLERHFDLPETWEDVAVDRQRFAGRWRAFAGDEPILMSWNKSNLDLVQATVGGDGEMVVLKGIYGNIANQAQGGIDDAMARFELEPRVPVFPGRAGRRMGKLLALHDLIRARVLGERCSPSSSNSTAEDRR